jgi:hypothetical protein
MSAKCSGSQRPTEGVAILPAHLDRAGFPGGIRRSRGGAPRTLGRRLQIPLCRQGNPGTPSAWEGSAPERRAKRLSCPDSQDLGARTRGLGQRGSREGLSVSAAPDARRAAAHRCSLDYRVGRGASRSDPGKARVRLRGVTAQALDRVLTSYRIGDPAGRYSIYDGSSTRRACPGWDHPLGAVSKPFGEKWQQSGRFAILIVPSVVARIDSNILINLEHAEACRITPNLHQPVWWDARLYGTLMSAP